jgi:hypothetical protein
MKSPTCTVCEGRRFYYWDPASGYCFAWDYEPLFVENEHNEIVQLTRCAPADPATESSVEEMLAALGEWSAGDRRRKFKLWYENGWNCYAWPNRFKSGAITAEHRELRRCVEECYRKVLYESRRRGIRKTQSQRHPES